MLTYLLLIDFILLCSSIELPTQCGKSRLHDTAESHLRIVGGQKAQDGFFPWLAFLNKSIIYENYEVFGDCGASIVNSRWLLTAAHCLQDFPDDLGDIKNTQFDIKVKIDVIFGAINVNAHEKSQVRRQVKRIVRGDYNLTMKSNDIALLELDKELDFAGNESHLTPVCLSDGPVEMINTTECYIAGFGYEDQQLKTNDYILHYVRESLVPHRDCDRVFDTYNATQNLCIGEMDKVGTCKGDSGNAMICFNNGHWTQIGLVSYGIPCSWSGIPDVLTNVVHFNEWIREQK